MPSQAEQGDIEFGRIWTVQRQIQDASELGHDTFYLYVLLEPASLSAMHAALKQYGYRVRQSRGWSAPDGPGQRCEIVRDASVAPAAPTVNPPSAHTQAQAPKSYALEISAASAVLRQFRTCEHCRHRSSGPHGCGDTTLRRQAQQSGVALECAFAMPHESAVLLLGLVKRQLEVIHTLTRTDDEQDQEN